MDDLICPAKLHEEVTSCDSSTRRRLHILIVGCGIGGLSAAYTLGRAGHKITVLERASEISDVGAGIQVAPNLSRLLIRWGLGDQLKQRASIPDAITFLRYASGERIGWTRWGEAMRTEYGAPYYHIHRADLLDMLHGLALPYMTLRLNAKVVGVDPHSATLTLENGENVRGDLILGADGLKSVVRAAVVGGASGARPPIHTGDSAYRAIVPTAAMRADPELCGLVESREMISWMGPEKHIIGYCIRGGEEYNLVLVRPDRESKESYMTEGSVAQMRADFAGWEPRIDKLLNLVERAYILPLMYREPLDNWVHPENKVVLLGDAAHPTLPSRAQGAAMAVEDAAVLGILFSLAPSSAPIGKLLHAYQSLRYARTAETQRAARANFDTFHLPDGPEQVKRDESMRKAMELEMQLRKKSESHAAGSDGEGSANIWADRKKSALQFGYDAEEEAQGWCRENSVAVYKAGLQQ